MQQNNFTIPDEEGPQRLDRAIASHVADISRETAKKIIAIGGAWVNGTRVRVVSRSVKAGDCLNIYVGRHGPHKFYEINPANILYRDQWLIFYRKEPGVPTQGVICDDYNNLGAGLSRYLNQQGRTPYLGMHQRLDLETSGVVVFTLDKKINRSIHYQFKDRRIKKTYLALAGGNPKFKQKKLTSYISRHEGKYRCASQGPGKTAVTTFSKLNDFEGYCLMQAEPETGRTHQIRLQLTFLDLPILGDSRYGCPNSAKYPRTMLHAESLTLFHPITKKDLTVKAELFDDMKQYMQG